MEWTLADGESALSLLDRSPPPARTLLGVLLFFALVIGPLNMLILARLRRRVLLFATTPVLGLVFAGGVFAYGVFRDGIHPFVHSESFTLLDQRTHVATSVAHVACLAPLTPGDGLMFDLRSMVMAWSGDYEERGPRLVADMSGAQRYASGLVTARSPSHVRQVRVAPQRERIALTEVPDGTLEVLNGLGTPIRTLFVARDSGVLYTVENLAAGAKANLRLLESGQPLPRATPWAEVARRVSTMNPGALCREYQTMRGCLVPNGGYAAILDASPFVETGLTGTFEHEPLSVIVGRFEEDASHGN
jgi:hypothetical protein